MTPDALAIIGLLLSLFQIGQAAYPGWQSQRLDKVQRQQLAGDLEGTIELAKGLDPYSKQHFIDLLRDHAEIRAEFDRAASQAEFRTTLDPIRRMFPEADLAAQIDAWAAAFERQRFHDQATDVDRILLEHVDRGAESVLERVSAVGATIVGKVERVLERLDPPTKRADPGDELAVQTYRDSLRRMFAKLEIPGTEIAGSIEERYIWPRLIEHQPEGAAFELEDPTTWPQPTEAALSLRDFPEAGLERAVIEAGAGFGKSALLAALMYRLSDSRRLPALVPLANLVEDQFSVADHLNQRVNADFAVKIDWLARLERGEAVVFFDGLDELEPGDRAKALRRVRAFEARFPNAPWLLAVRDAHALAQGLEATTLAIQPFGIGEIFALARAYGRHAADNVDMTLQRQLENADDLAQMLRVPLLATIFTVTWEPGNPPPRSRIEVIERYLELLLRPERHKIAPEREVNVTQLREATEALAFSALERGAIGTTEAEALRFLGDSTPDPHTLLDRLLERGLLRRAGQRLQFPYPIVQEYLAACHLIKHHPEALAARLSRAATRPWAQTMQFVLEAHPEPDDLVRQALDSEDDVFLSTHRLIGRCVANGAGVSPEVRAFVEQKLVAVWGRAKFAGQRRIAQILADGFSQPVRTLLLDVLEGPQPPSGFDLIVHLQPEPIYLNVLAAHLERRPFDNSAVNPLMAMHKAFAPKIAGLVLEAAKRPDNTPEAADALARYIQWFERIPLPPEACVEAARNDRLRLTVRLACALRCTDALGDSALELARQYLRWPRDPMETIGYTDLAMKVLWSRDASGAAWRDCLLDETIPLKTRHDLALGLHQLDQSGSMPEVEQRIREGLETAGLHPSLRDDLLLLLTIRDDPDALNEATRRLGALTDKQRQLWLSLVSKRRDLALLTRGLEAVRTVVMRGEEKTMFIRNGHVFQTAVTNIGIGGWGGQPQRWTEALALLGDLAADWSQYERRADIRLQLLIGAADRGRLDVLPAIRAEVDRWLFEMPERECILASRELSPWLEAALSTLKGTQQQADLEYLVRCLDLKYLNVKRRAFELIADRGDRAALEVLLERYNRAAAENRPELYLFERLSLRLGVRLFEVRGQMVFEADP